MLEHRCGSCKWWEPTGVASAEKQGIRHCALAECIGTDPEYPETAALACSSQGGRQRLFTTANYGCPQWQER